MRLAIVLRVFQILARRIGTTKVRKFAAFKTKKFYLSFRPVQKLKSAARKKQQTEEETARQAFERMANLMYEVMKSKLNKEEMLPKKKQKTVNEHQGILAIFKKDKVITGTFSVNTGY